MQQVQQKEIHSKNREGARMSREDQRGKVFQNESWLTWGHMALELSFLPHPWMAGTVCSYPEICPPYEEMNSMHQDTELERRLRTKAGSLGPGSSWQRVEARPRATGVSPDRHTHTPPVLSKIPGAPTNS